MRLLRKLTQFLSYRGPDALEVWSDGAIGFGHAMVHATRESRKERQPANLEGKFWITADCRLDQRGELQARLAKEGVRPSRPWSDCELILNAYAVWGEKSFMGRKYMGIHRVTFLVGPDGKIKKIWPKVKPEEHAEEVLAAL